MKLETSPGNPALIPSLPNDGDLLTKEYHFLQIFQVKREQAPEFEQALRSYIHFLLNGFGLFFYRASYSTSSLSSSSSSSPPAGGPTTAAALPFQHLPPSSQDGPSAGPEPPRVLFTVNLSLFTAKRLLEEVYPPLAPLKARQALDSRRLLDDFLDPSLYSGYWSELLYEQASARRQPVFRPEQMPKSTHHGHIKELGWGASELFTRWWLIMPRAQWDFFDLLYQTYTFDIAHQSYQTKITHFFTIPANICMTVCLLCQFTFGFDAAGPFGPSLGLLSSLLLSLIYLAYGAAKNVRAWGVATACATMLLYLVAGLWDHAFRLPDAPWYNPTGSLLTNPLSLLYLASILEAWSHMIVPQLPPFCLGRNHWEDTWNFILNGERLFQFLGVVAAFIFSPLVSYISCIHLIGDMTIYLMLHLGYNQGFFEDYCRLVRKAELTGNPNVDDVPFKFHQLIHGMPGNSGDCLPAKR